MDLNNIGRDCPCYEFDNSEMSFDIGEFNGLAPNNGKLTLNVNGVEAGEFYANQQEDTTIDIQTVTQQDIDDAVSSEATIRERADRDLQANIDGERLAREQADRTLQGQIDAIASKSDVVDVVGTYAELQAYDTSKLDDNDVVKVLDDVTHNDSMTYYRWNEATQTWSYIGQESPYYSKSQTDTLLATKQDTLTAGTGITLNGSTISADTTVLAEKSELSNYAEKSDTYTKTEVDNLVEPKLSVEVEEQLPAQGEQNKLYLTEKAHTTQTATGNPITATITDGAGQIEDFQLDGDTFQQSYEGWNIIDVDFENTTSAGVTKTLNADKTITLNGKINAGLNFTFGKDISFDTSSQYTLKVEVLRGSSTPYTNDGLPNHQWAVMVNMGLSSLGWQSYAVMCADNVTTVTFTPAQSTGQPRFWFGYNASTADETTGIFNDYTLRISVKKGTTISGYEPFVGGIASPNPSYPQPIQVVTGEQTVSKVGKNLFDKNNYSSLDAYINSSDVIAYGNGALSVYIECEPNTTYTVSKTNTGTNQRFCVYTTEDRPAVGVTVLATVGTKAGQDTNTSYTITTGANAKYLGVFCRVSSTSLTEAEIVATIQIEKSTSATTYAPYSKTDYHISLGSIELCKLGTYQDYIYKDGDTWKVHKATATYTFDDSLLSWQRNTQISGGYVLSYNVNSPFYGLLAVGIPSYSSKCTHFTIQNNSATWTGVGKAGFNSFGAFWCMTNIANIDNFLDWLDEDNPELFYPLATPTDTEITDATLISQLNTIASASLETGTNTLTNSATGSNLAGDMEVGYFGYDPTNRYDKWLWLDINNAYEKLGS